MTKLNETPEEIRLRAQLAEAERKIIKLEHQNDEMRKLVSMHGFVDAWFNECEKHKNGHEAFLCLNMRYLSYFGVERYTSYKSFENVKNRFLHKENKK